MPTPSARGARAVLAALSLLVHASCSSATPHEPARPGAAPDPALHAFLTESFGGISQATLRTNAVPYKVVMTALVLAEEERVGRALDLTALPGILTRFGFLYPERIEGWPAGVPRPGADAPLGLLRATVGGPVPGVRVEGATLGCASCHAGVTYDSAGRPTRTVWPGLPNTSLNVDAYVLAAYRGLQRADADPAAFRRRFAALYPDVSFRERLTLRFILQPAIRKRLAELRRAGDRPTPFSNGGPGRTNGVAALHRQLGLLGDGVAAPHAVGFTSIPDLSGRGLRTSLLYDGVYAPRGQVRFGERTAAGRSPAHVDSLAAIVAYFTVPTMGVTADVAQRGIPRAEPVMRWFASRYVPPSFPGRIDVARAARGEALYEAGCASCHGRHASGPAPRALAWFPNRLVPQAEMGTDSARWAMVDTAFLGALNRTSFARYATPARTGGYVAPILSGVWATAPYLHNGSVPTLWALFSPAARPVAFPVGGHRLDYTDVGIALDVDAGGVASYPGDHVPWSTPELYDTRKPGLSNRGHERYTAALSDDEKRDLIEYLKLL
jgi:mono/diheme cytochrome c family protein